MSVPVAVTLKVKLSFAHNPLLFVGCVDMPEDSQQLPSGCGGALSGHLQLQSFQVPPVRPHGSLNLPNVIFIPF
jgi:hypothetical protein